MYKVTQAVKYVVSTLLKIFIIFIFAFPFLWIVSLALQTDSEIAAYPPVLIPSSFQWINFVNAWKAAPFALYFRNSFIIITAIIVISMVIMVPTAYAFAKYEFPGKSILFGLVLIAFMTPVQVTFVPVYYMMSDWGLLGTLLPQILPFMVDAFGIFLLRQYFMQVPEELIEAARLDNASELKIVFKIMMPLSKPALSTVFLFSFVTHWNDYFWPLVMTNSAEVRPITIGVAALKDSEGVEAWNKIMAGNLFLVAPIVLVYIFCSRFIIRAFAYNGVK